MSLFNKLTTQTKAYLVTAFIVLVTLGIWQAATLPTQVAAPTDPIALEYEVLMGNIPEHTPAGAVVANGSSPKRFASVARVFFFCLNGR